MKVFRCPVGLVIFAAYALIACSGGDQPVGHGSPPPGGSVGGGGSPGGSTGGNGGDAGVPSSGLDAGAPGAGGGAGSDAGSGGPTGSSGAAIAALSDQFAGTHLDPSWVAFNTSTVDLSLRSGALHLQPRQSLLWYNDSEGALVYKLVSGDFKVTSVVRARSAANPSQAPANTIHLGGLMARSPASSSSAENYVFVVVGHQMEGLAVETKSTTNSSSDYQGPAWQSGDAELRLCRSGSTFTLLKRPVGATAWQQAGTYARPDLPGTLQVGPNVYAYMPSGGAPDLDVAYEGIKFSSLSGDCAAD